MTDHTEELLKVPQLGAFIDWAWSLKERIAALEAENERLRAALAEQGERQEAVARVGMVTGTDFKSLDFFKTDLQELPVGTMLYATPQPGPDVRALVEALDGLASGARTINRGHQHKVMIEGDDEPCFWQRREWVEYLISLCDEADKALAALATYRQDT